MKNKVLIYFLKILKYSNKKINFNLIDNQHFYHKN